VGDLDRVRGYAERAEPRGDSGLPLEFAPLMIAVGLRGRAVRLIEAAMAPGASHSGIAETAEQLWDRGEGDLAVRLARRAVQRDPGDRYGGYRVLAAAGFVDEVLAEMRAFEVSRYRRPSLRGWLHAATALHRASAADRLAEPLRSLLERGVRSPDLAAFLTGLGTSAART